MRCSISTKPLKAAKTGYLVFSIVMVLLGLVFFFQPNISIEIICNIIGVFAILYGVVKIIGYFSTDLYRLAFQYDLASGILIIILGILMLAMQKSLVAIFWTVSGIIIFADGLFKIQIAIDARRFGLAEWIGFLCVAVLTSLFGVLLIIKPVDSAEVIMRIFGIAMALEGVLNFIVAMYAVRVVKETKKDIFDMEEQEL